MPFVWISGTRIVYERKFLLHCRNSPHSMSPPCNLPTIPGVTEPEEKAASEERTPAPSGDAAAQKPKENIAPSEVRSKLRLISKRSFKRFYIICLTMAILLQCITMRLGISPTKVRNFVMHPHK